LDRFQQVLWDLDCQQLGIHPFMLVHVLIVLSLPDVVEQLNSDLSMID